VSLYTALPHLLFSATTPRRAFQPKLRPKEAAAHFIEGVGGAVDGINSDNYNSPGILIVRLFADHNRH